MGRSPTRRITRNLPFPVITPTAAQAESRYCTVPEGNVVSHATVALYFSLHFLGSTISHRADSAYSITVSHTTEVVAASSGQEQNVTVDSDAEGVDTNAGVVFAPASKMKKALEKKAMAMASGLSNSTS